MPPPARPLTSPLPGVNPDGTTTCPAQQGAGDPQLDAVATDADFAGEIHRSEHLSVEFVHPPVVFRGVGAPQEDAEKEDRQRGYAENPADLFHIAPTGLAEIGAKPARATGCGGAAASEYRGLPLVALDRASVAFRMSRRLRSP